MSNLLTLFHFDASHSSFEDLGKPNGATHWRADDLMRALDYESDAAFSKAITRAKQACLSLGLEIEDHDIARGLRRRLFRHRFAGRSAGE